MRFLSRVRASRSTDSPADRGRASTGRHCSRIELETLENRDLLSIAGVALQFGNLTITGTRSSGNVAKVWIDSSTHEVAVSLNGQSEEFTASQVASVTYKAGASGGDTFVNNTALTTLEYGYGGRDHFTGGTGFNYVYFFGNNNSYTAQDGVTDVWKDYGSGDTVANPLGGAVTVYSS